MATRAGPNHPLFKSHPNQIANIRRGYGFDNTERLNAAIDILDAWTKKQTHFMVKEFDRDYLEGYIIRAKGSVEKAKKQLDKRLTLTKMIPEIFGTVLDNYESELLSIPKAYKHAELPIPTPDYFRVSIDKVCSEGVDDLHLIDHGRFIHVVAEYNMMNDYILGYECIIDFTDVQLSELLPKLNPLVLQKNMTMIIDGYATKIKSIHILSSSKLVEVLTSLLKQGMSEKIGNRIQLHHSYEELHKFIPKESLPSDYGGTAPSIKEIHESMVNELISKRHTERMKLVATFATDESKRISSSFNNEYMGMPGSFRTLTVD